MIQRSAHQGDLTKPAHSPAARVCGRHVLANDGHAETGPPYKRYVLILASKVTVPSTQTIPSMPAHPSG